MYVIPSWCVCVVACCPVRVLCTCAGKVSQTAVGREVAGRHSHPQESERQCAFLRTSPVPTSSGVDHERSRAGRSPLGSLLHSKSPLHSLCQVGCTCLQRHYLFQSLGRGHSKHQALPTVQAQLFGGWTSLHSHSEERETSRHSHLEDQPHPKWSRPSG